MQASSHFARTRVKAWHCLYHTGFLNSRVRDLEVSLALLNSDKAVQVMKDKLPGPVHYPLLLNIDNCIDLHLQTWHVREASSPTGRLSSRGLERD